MPISYSAEMSRITKGILREENGLCAGVSVPMSDINPNVLVLYVHPCPKIDLAHLNRMEFPIPINWTIPFPF